MDTYAQTLALWRGYRIQTAGDIDLRLDNFRVLFAYNSGKIENDAIRYHDTREIFENGRVLNFSGHPRVLFELENQRLCYEFLKEKIAARVPLRLALIREIHAVLTAGTYDERRFVQQGERPGDFKRHDYVTGRAEVGSLPETVETDLQELLDALADYADRDTLKVAAYFHARFEYIHPFADGNGRVGRTLLNYFLMTQGHPPIVIHNEDKAAYYAALEAYDEAEDLVPMHDFLMRQTVKTWQKMLARVVTREDF
ncbi:MAG: Fic family protein [Oscillospiraceae bacterium]|jgi:Fic family protein|nr:Fic family protein [Oscillospiraceae bacterium]